MHKKQQTNTLFDQLNTIFNKLAERLGSPETEQTMKEYLRNLGKFHKYSPNNVLLIVYSAIARGIELERVASFKAWKNFKNEEGEAAHVLKGEHGLPVFVPVKIIQYQKDEYGSLKYDKDGNKIPCLDENGEIIRRKAFKKGSVFDVSQTNAKEIGAYKSLEYRDMNAVVDDTMLENIAKRIEKEYNISVNFKHISGANGSYDYILDEINISNSDSLTPANRLSTLFHELGHKVLHGEKIKNHEISYVQEHNQRGFIEGEAEAFGFALSSMYGIDNRSEFYLASWGNKPDDIKEKIQLLSEAVSNTIKTLKLGENLNIEEHLIQTREKAEVKQKIIY